MVSMSSIVGKCSVFIKCLQRRKRKFLHVPNEKGF